MGKGEGEGRDDGGRTGLELALYTGWRRLWVVVLQGRNCAVGSAVNSTQIAGGEKARSTVEAEARLVGKDGAGCGRGCLGKVADACKLERGGAQLRSGGCIYGSPSFGETKGESYVRAVRHRALGPRREQPPTGSFASASIGEIAAHVRPSFLRFWAAFFE